MPANHVDVRAQEDGDDAKGSERAILLLSASTRINVLGYIVVSSFRPQAMVRMSKTEFVTKYLND